MPQKPPAHPSGTTPPPIPKKFIPQHVAVVMDGNGRWANERGLPRNEGHRAGEAALLDIVAGAIEMGIPYISAYAFSTENWKRSPSEVSFIMRFSTEVLNRQLETLKSWGSTYPLGRTPPQTLAKNVISQLEQCERETINNTTCTLTMCVNYGGRRRNRRRSRNHCTRRTSRHPQTLLYHRKNLPKIPRRTRPTRRRPLSPIIRRTTNIQLPPLAKRLRRIRLHERTLARCRPPNPL